MTREKELNKVKQIMKEYYEDAKCGLFKTRNFVGDPMVNIFQGEYFDIDICFHYSYFEVFGTNAKEWEELRKFYEMLEEEMDT